MSTNILDESRKQNQRMVKIQNQIESIQFSVDNSISAFQVKSKQIQERNQKYQKFLEGLQQRSYIIHQYTEEILKKEYDLTIEKTNYEVELSKKVKSMRAEDKKLTSELASCRKRLIEICSQKTQFSTTVSTLSVTISTLEDEEIKLDKLQSQAERIIAKLKLSIKSDPVSFNNSEIDHYKKLIDFTDQQQKLVKRNIEQCSVQMVSLNDIISKMNSKTIFLNEMKEKALDYIYKSNKFREYQMKKFHLQQKIEEKDKCIKEFNKKAKKIRKDILNHKNNECESFVDSRRSMNHSSKLLNMRDMIHKQIQDTKFQLNQLRLANEDLFSEEKTLKSRVTSFNQDLSVMNESCSLVESELNFAKSKIEKINSKDIETDRLIESYLKEYDSLQKQIKNEIIESASLKSQLNESKVISVNFDTDVNIEKEQVIKKTDLLQCQIDDVFSDMEQLKKDIIRYQLIRDENEAQKDKLDSDIQSKHVIIKKCNDFLRSDLTLYSNKRTVSDSFYSHEISRNINSRILSETLSQLQTAVNLKRETIQHRKDDLSSQRNSITTFLTSYYEDIPTTTETLKRSIKFAIQENPLQDRIQTLNFLMENLESIQTSFDQQLNIWKELFEKENESLILDDWQIDLNRLNEKADDLIIFNQVFGLTP